MMFLLDTNIIRTLLFHFPKKGEYFERVWECLDNRMIDGTVASVDECYNELLVQFSKDHASIKWILERKRYFLNPTCEESTIIRELFCLSKMRESIHTKNIYNGNPSADVYIAAKAKALSATVVTAEEYKPHSSQLPNICEHLGVECISFDDFMEQIMK